MSPDELDDALRALDPVDAAAVPDAADSRARAIRDQVLAEVQPRRRAGRVLVAAVAATMVLVGGTVAATLLTQREVTDPAAVVCFEAADLESSRAAVSVDEPSVAACAELWTGATFSLAGVRPGDVPPLAGCTLEAGLLGVFPAVTAVEPEDVCGQLGLPVATLGRIDANPNLVGVLGERLPPGSCVELDEAAEISRAALDELALDDWTVVVSTDATDDRPCASFSVDRGALQVVLVPVPVPPDD